MSTQPGRTTKHRATRHKRRASAVAAPDHQQSRLPAPWMAVGTLVASTAVTSLLPAPAAAQNRATPPPGQDRTARQVAGATDFDIPAGSIASVAAAFTRLTGIEVTLSNESLASLPSPGVSGVLTTEDALQQLLAGTGLQFRLTSPQAVTIDLAALTESVDVTGRAPVVASSPKYTQPLRDTPQTMVVIPQAVLQEQGATTLRDALRNTPGITLTAGEGGTAPGDNILIRGFSARNDVYIDGARDPGVVSRDTFNVESVEVAKGPSSVTAGRGSTGGSVNLVTKSAGLQNAGEIRLSGGNADQKRGTIDLNRRVSATVGLRLNVMMQDSGVPGRDEVTNKGWGFAPSIGFGLGSPTTVSVGYQRLHQDNVPDYGLPGTLPELAASSGITVDDLDFSNFYGLLSRDHEKVTSDLVTATVEHRFTPGRSLRNLTRYGRNTLDRVVTPPRAATAANAAADPGYDPSIPQIRRTDTKYQYRDDRTVTNQTDLTMLFETGGMRHSTVAGVEVAHDRQPSYAATDLYVNGRPPVTDLFHPDPEQSYRPAIERTGATSEAHSTSLGAYAFDTVSFSDRLQADLGVRWDRIDVNYDTVSTANEAASFGRVDRAVSGRAGLVYKPSARGSIYGVFSTSFNPSYDGAFGLTLGATGKNDAALPPERNRNLEVGTKWDVTPGLFATVAAFHTEKTNAKTTDAASGATVLAGDQEVSGIEFGLSGTVTADWSVFAGLSLMHGRIEESLVSAEVDRRLSYVPEQSFNLWSSYRLSSRTTVGAGAQFTGGYYFNNTNALSSDNAAAIQRLTRYWLFSAMVGHRLSDHLDLQINMTNLSGTRYVERGYTGHFLPGSSRSIVVSPVITF